MEFASMTFSTWVPRILFLFSLSFTVNAQATGPGPLGGVLPGTLASIGNTLPAGTGGFTDVYTLMIGPATDVSLLVTLSAADVVNVGGTFTPQVLPSFSAQLFQGSPADPLPLAVAAPTMQDPNSGGLSMSFSALSANASYFLQVTGSFPAGMFNGAYSGQLVAGNPVATVTAAVPEPTPVGLLCAGMLVLTWAQSRRRSREADFARL
jgi:hypothetical protein